MNFNLNEKQESKLKKWKEAINTIYGHYGSYTYCFKHSGGIGETVTVINDIVGSEYSLDLTDIDSW